MPRASTERLRKTVDIMEPEWTRIIERTGDLTPDDMKRSLSRRYNQGHRDFVVAQEESTLQRMNAMLIGDE